MTAGFVVRGAVQALAAHAIVSALVSVAVALTWRLAVRGVPGQAAVAARRLFRLRAAPGTAGVVVGSLVAVAYLLWEPRIPHEGVGAVPLASAGAGLAFAVAALWRLARAVRDTRRIRRALAAATSGPLTGLPMPAFVVDTRFPVVALDGVMAVRLFVARSVLDACTPAELEAVLAHEQAHAAERDNLRRLALTGTPDLLGMLPAGRRIQAAWAGAAELAADERAARHTGRGWHLASALVKVARLAVAPPAVMPASALYRGEPVATRVRRLLDPPAPARRRAWPWWARLAGAAAAAAAAPLALPPLHRAAEALLALGLASAP